MIQQKYCIVQLKIVWITSPFEETQKSVKRSLFKYESGKLSYEESRHIIKQTYGSRILRTATSAVDERTRWEERKRERRNSSSFIETDREWGDNEGVTDRRRSMKSVTDTEGRTLS